MKKIDATLPEWLEDYHTLQPKVHIRISRPWDTYERVSLFLALTCPPIFDAYAIILHPFWINKKGKELAKNGAHIEVDSLKDEDFNRVSWKAFFWENGLDFSLQTALADLEKLSTKVMNRTGDWPEYCWFPGEGECEASELQTILAEVNNLLAINEVNYHYNFLRAVKWDKDLQYRGVLDEFENLPIGVEVRGNPSSIYPDDKSWYIGSNYDLPFSFVGGSRALINSITQNEAFEIFEIDYSVKPES